MKTDFPQNDDKTRILKDIIVWLEMGRHPKRQQEYRNTVIGRWKVDVDYRGEISPQFVPFSLSQSQITVPKGSIVKCTTNPNHDWGISRYVSHANDENGHHYLLQEIGNPERTLRMYNEALDVLIGVPWHVTAEGWERKIYEWSIKAMQERWNKRVDYYLRFRDAEVHEGVLRMKIGRHAWVNSKQKETPEGVEVYRYRDRVFDIPVDKKTRLRDIVQALHDQNFDAEWTEDELELNERSTASVREAQMRARAS